MVVLGTRKELQNTIRTLKFIVPKMDTVGLQIVQSSIMSFATGEGRGVVDLRSSINFMGS